MKSFTLLAQLFKKKNIKIQLQPYKPQGPSKKGHVKDWLIIDAGTIYKWQARLREDRKRWWSVLGSTTTKSYSNCKPKRGSEGNGE